MIHNINDHYWIIGGSSSEVYSSATNTMVPSSDAAYVAWTEVNQVSQIPSVEELVQPLQANGSRLPSWIFNAPSFIQPATGAYDAEQLKAYNDDARWRKEQGGLTTTAGFPIKTDDRAQAKITGVYAASKESPAVVTPWHAADGTVHELDATGMYNLNADLLTHINNCFSISADNYAAIDAGTITTLEQIDSAYAAPITQERKDWLEQH